MLEKSVLASKPQVIHHANMPAHSNAVLVLERKSTENVSCNVMVAVARQVGVGFKITSAVRYEFGGKWYAKDVHTCFTLAEAVRRADGLSRKLYKTTASRALAGLLHDSVVPATDDIDF